MKRSTERILTTHTGSLPRPPELLEILEGHDQREARAHPDYAPRVQAAVKRAVEQQTQAGIDIPTDGEMGRVAFSWYATERLTGFDGPPRSVMQRVEQDLFPEFYAAVSVVGLNLPACNGPITWRGPEYIDQDIANLKAAMQGVAAEEVFMPAVSPGQLWLNFGNDYYPNDEAFIMAAADALRNEYRAIVDAGFVLQLDDPGLAMGWNRVQFGQRLAGRVPQNPSNTTSRRSIRVAGHSADRVRLHTCWGNSEATACARYPHWSKSSTSCTA